MIRRIRSAALLTALTAGALVGHAVTLDDCHPVDVSESSAVSYADALAMRADGWTGRTDDGAELLYPPACRV